MRRFGETWRADAPYRQRPGAYAAILRGRMMLLASTPAAGNALLMPGGGVDPGESPLQALHREVMEETGWTVAPIRRLGAFQRYCHLPDYGFWARKVCMIHLCRAGRQVAAPSEPDHAPVWMRIEDAADALSVDGERHFTRQLLRSMG